ncbi:MAG: excinuclease ABC subunit UvrC [PVC group bacterium]|nr:excinuclease ABC subunit UvrC [PVC group bacterium]
MKLIDKVKTLPDNPGVYLMKDSSGGIIYIGKASSLKKRVGSYFSKTTKNVKQQALVNNIKDIDSITTTTEAEALILESGLIKEYKPKYNTAIKDDKAYPLLKLTFNEKYPRLVIVRRRKNDGASYFGPYTSVRLLRQALAFMRRIFPLRTCRVMPKSVCLNYHLDQCLGPCINKSDKKEYSRVLDNLLLFLNGKKAALINKLSSEMKAASLEYDFERALRLRDEIESLSTVPSKYSKGKVSDQVAALQSVLRLKNRPNIIEGFDISNIFGNEAVGSMVRFKNGKPEKKNYRRFKIKTVDGINDYAMIEEVVGRRYQGSLAKKLELPDVILIDGGKGHLECACRKLLKAGVNIPVASIAKKFEHIYVQWQETPIALPRDSKALHLLMRVRDEAHRFAVSYHRLRRKKEMFPAKISKKK